MGESPKHTQVTESAWLNNKGVRREAKSEGIYVRLSCAETFFICIISSEKFLYKVMDNNRVV